MAKIIYYDGTEKEITDLSFENLYEELDCDTIQVILTRDGQQMFMDENGKFAKGKVVNQPAIDLCDLFPGDSIVGPVMVCTPAEMKAWEDLHDDEEHGEDDSLMTQEMQSHERDLQEESFREHEAEFGEYDDV